MKLGEGGQRYSAASVDKGKNWKSHSISDEETRNLLVKSLPCEQARESVFNPQKTHYNQQGRKNKSTTALEIWKQMPGVHWPANLA